MPVVEWGVFLYWNSNCASVSERGPSFIFFRPSLRILTARSAKPFDAGWYGDTKMWRIPFERQNPANSEDENWGPLSNTIVSCRPNLANIWRSCWIVVRDVAVVMGATSIHFECASMRTRNMVPATGPAKSMWSRDHGREGHTHGCSGADSGNVWHCWQLKHCFTVLSMSWSNPGHHINPRTTAFIRVQSGGHNAILLGEPHGLEVGPLPESPIRYIHWGLTVPGAGSSMASILGCPSGLAILPGYSDRLLP